MKDHEIREAINELRDIALRFHSTANLRARIEPIVWQIIGSCRAENEQLKALKDKEVS